MSRPTDSAKRELERQIALNDRLKQQLQASTRIMKISEVSKEIIRFTMGGNDPLVDSDGMSSNPYVKRSCFICGIGGKRKK
ncbi:hypothetical protein ADUPG1_013440 [Aduncisulcus paluster]|uniref:G protein gamma domain-containing protein n=1 Tax=Aduncisulcus paluster TaxID=2918883 RepID=A0ABQ5K2X0_9EUKA|nr:hypothetical protein ADUPG1_013440 [Aduncisulcus paluster]